MRLKAQPSGHHYHLDIAGAGAPLLLLHGFTGDSSIWRDLAAKLPPDLRPIRLDILGHGNSDKPSDQASYRMPALAADILDLLNQLQLQQAHLLGYSMGGRLALYLALRHPDRFASLILESASPGLANAPERAERRRRDETLAELIEARGASWFADYWERLPLWDTQATLPAEHASAQRKHRKSNDPRGLANSLRGLGTGAQPSLWHNLPKLTIPTLLIAGELDAKFLNLNQAMAQQIPNASLVVIPSAGHNTHLEDPSAFAQAVRSFLVRP